LIVLLLVVSASAQTPRPTRIATDGVVQAMTIEGTTLYVGGSFQNVGNMVQSLAYFHEPSVGDVPFSFFPGAVTGQAFCVIPDGAQGWYVGGTFQEVGGYARPYLARIRNDLSVDQTFLPDIGGHVYTMALFDGELFVGGDFQEVGGNAIHHLCRMNAETGEVDITWLPEPDGQVTKLLISNGDLYVAGSFEEIAGRHQPQLAGLDPATGTIQQWSMSIEGGGFVSALESAGDTLFIGGGFPGIGLACEGLAKYTAGEALPSLDFPKATGYVNVIVPDMSGGYYVGGSFERMGDQEQPFLAHIMPDMSMDLTFAPQLNGTVEALALDGNWLYVGGSFSEAGGNSIGRLCRMNKMTGQIDLSWLPEVQGNAIRSIAVHTVGVFVEGLFDQLNGEPRSGLAAIDASTAEPLPWDPMLGQPPALVHGLKLISDSLYVFGSFTSISGSARNGMAKFDLPAMSLSPWSTPEMDGVIMDFTIHNGDMILGGSFSSVGGHPRSNLAKFDALSGEVDLTWTFGTDYQVVRVDVLNDSLFLAGGFSEVSGLPRSGLACVPLSGSDVGPWDPSPNLPGSIRDFELLGQDILVFGAFTHVNWKPRSALAAVDPTNGRVLDWDPAPVGNVHDLEVEGSDVFVGGNFSVIGGQPRDNFAVVDRETGVADAFWNVPVDGEVISLEMAEGQLFLTGNFNHVDGVSRSYAGAVDAISGSVLDWDPRPSCYNVSLWGGGEGIFILGPENCFYKHAVRNNIAAFDLETEEVTEWEVNVGSVVMAIEVSDTTLYIGGYFEEVNSQPRARLAAVGLGSGTLLPWDPTCDGAVEAIAASEDAVYVGGNFYAVGGQTRRGLAKIDVMSGAAFPAFNADLNERVWDLELSAAELYVAGYFTTAGGFDRNGIADVSLATGLPLSLDIETNGNVYDLEVTQNTLYVSGVFSDFNGLPRTNVAAVDRATKTITSWKPAFDGSVQGMALGGGFAIAIGQFSSSADQVVQNLAILNANTGLGNGFRPVLEGVPYALARRDSSLFVGGSITSVNGIPASSIAKVVFPAKAFDARVDLIRSDHAGNLGRKGFTIYGNGFADGTSVVLRKAGEDDIPCTDVNTLIRDGREIAASAELTDVAIGTWDVVISIPGDTVITVVNGFEVQDAVLPQLSLEIVGPSGVRGGTWADFLVNIRNSGNLDAMVIPIYIAIPPSSEYKILPKLVRDDTIPHEIWDTLSWHIDLDTLFGEERNVRVIPLLVSQVPGGGSTTVGIRALLSGSGTIEAWFTAPYTAVDSTAFERNGGCGNPAIPPCYIDGIEKGLQLAGLAAEFLPGQAGCVASIVLETAESVVSALDCRTSSEDKVAGFVMAPFKIIVGCIPDGDLSGKWAAAQEFAKILLKADAASELMNEGEDDDPCRKPKQPRGPASLPVTVVASGDPNAKYGPLGYGGNTAINTHGPISYQIAFENVDTATAAAQHVWIIDTLDLDVFDINTVRFKGFGFGDTVIFMNQPLPQSQMLVDLRPAMDLVVQVSMRRDDLSGELRWDFVSLDPSTMQLTTDVFAGFLPPNITSPEGQGWVSFSVETYSGLPDSTIVSNSAHIYFDYNDPITTNEWSNITDNTPPSSQAAALPPVTTVEEFTVSWSGTDNPGGAGVLDYTVYYAVNGGPFRLWLSNVRVTSASFIGEMDSTYAFYTVARDSADNYEAPPGIHDAQTTIVIVTGLNEVSDAMVSDGCLIYPNPFNDAVNIRYIATSSEPKTMITLTDALGRVVDSRNFQTKLGVNAWNLDAVDLVSGVYHVVLQHDSIRFTRRIVKR